MLGRGNMTVALPLLIGMSRRSEGEDSGISLSSSIYIPTAPDGEIYVG
jgi:hypothetical protein